MKLFFCHPQLPTNPICYSSRVHLAFAYGVTMLSSYSELLLPLCGLWGQFLISLWFCTYVFSMACLPHLPSLQLSIMKSKMHLASDALHSPTTPSSAHPKLPAPYTQNLIELPSISLGSLLPNLEPLHSWSLTPDFLLAFCCVPQTCKLKGTLSRRLYITSPCSTR